MEKRYAAAALSLSLAALLTACTGTASHDEQMEYLRKMAQRGADMHVVHGRQGSPGDREECVDDYEQLYEGLHGPDAPYLENYDDKVDLLDQGKQLFIESCVNGTPAPVPGDPVQPASPSAPPASRATPSASPSA